MAVVADGSVRRVAVGRRRVRDLLRIHRRREQPVGSRAVRRHDAGRAAGDGGGGLPPHRGPGRPRGQLDPPAEGADAGQAVLRLLRARARPTRRTTCRRSGPTSTQGQFDDGWDVQRERTFARQKELGVIPADAELTARHAEITGVGRHARRAQAGARRARWRCTPGSSSTPTTTSDG